MTTTIGRRPVSAITRHARSERLLPTRSAVKRLVDDRLDALNRTPTSDLIDLPASSVEHVVGDNHRDIAIATYHHDLGEGRHFLLVHGSRRWLNGLLATSVVAAGIEVSASGTRHVLTPGELNDCLQLLGL